MQVATQMDLATEPRWKRISGTFGEDPRPVNGYARAVINGWQSTYDENEMIWVGRTQCEQPDEALARDGAAEARRESHTRDGAYTFPGRPVFYSCPAICSLYGPAGQDRNGNGCHDELFNRY